MLIIRRLNCIDVASGIVTLSQWPSCAQVASVWQELDYRIEICRVTKGGHIDTSKVGQKLGVSLPLLTCPPST